MRISPVVLLLIALLAPPAYGQVDADPCVVPRQLPYTPHVVETEATALAKSERYLDTAPAATPTALMPGDLFLRIDGHPFTLFIRPADQHTDVKLESRRMTTSPGEKEALRAKAEAFFRQLAERLG